MAYKPNEVFWAPKNFQSAQRCRCKYHSDLLGFNVWVSTDWKKESEAGPDRYEVRATATSLWCRKDHPGATDDRVITQAAWDAAAALVNWDFFPTI